MSANGDALLACSCGYKTDDKDALADHLTHLLECYVCRACGRRLTEDERLRIGCQPCAWGMEEARPSRLGTAYMAILPLFALLMTFALTGNLLAALLACWAVSMAECLGFIDGRRQQQKASEQGESRG